MVSALLVAEHDGRDLNPSSARCVSCAVSFAGDAVDIVVFADDGPRFHWIAKNAVDMSAEADDMRRL